MNDENSKIYTAEEAAILVLKKTEELLKNSKLTKSNTSHEVEAGAEPNNEDAECPAYLAEADIESGSSTGKHGEGKSGSSEMGAIAGEAGEGEDEVDEDGKKKKKIPKHEEGLGEEEKEMHDSTESESDEEEVEEDKKVESQEKDEADADKIEDKEEKKKPVGIEKSCKGSECGQMPTDLKKPSKLNSFMEKRKLKKKIVKVDPSKKNKKVEKFLGLGGTKTSGQAGTMGQGKPAAPAQGQSLADKINFGGKRPAPKPPKSNSGY